MKKELIICPKSEFSELPEEEVKFINIYNKLNKLLRLDYLCEINSIEDFKKKTKND